MHLNQPKILVVDDEAPILITVKAILEKEGYAVDTCPDGESAIRAVGRNHYDLVLTDLKMPRIDGLGVLAQVQKQSPDTVTVMMTGFGSVDSALEAVQLGAYEYLMKPVGVHELKLAVRRSLERKRLSEIDALYSVSRALTRMHDAAEIGKELRNAVQRVLAVEHARFVVFARETETASGDAELREACSMAPIVDALRDGRLISSEDHPAVREWASKHGIESVVLVPGIAAERLVCVLAADNAGRAYDFHAASRRFLFGLASQAAMGVESALLVSELRTQNEELAAANEKLRELDRLKSQFLSVATHELRTPLSVILGYNAMLAESLSDRLSVEESETLRESVTACKRLMRLVNSMLDVTQIESGRMQMNFAPADLRTTVNGVLSLLRPEAQSKNVRLLLEIPARVPRAFVDAERIEQVLINLVGNALKFTQSGGSVTVSLRYRPESSAIDIAVGDTGRGMTPEEQRVAFDEFAQGQRHRSRSQLEGAGLGLAIVKRIIEAHEGTIRVASNVGQGTTFTFTLPLNLPHQAQTAVSA